MRRISGDRKAFALIEGLWWRIAHFKFDGAFDYISDLDTRMHMSWGLYVCGGLQHGHNGHQLSVGKFNSLQKAHRASREAGAPRCGPAGVVETFGRWPLILLVFFRELGK
jgi:hypothetical protein